MNEKNTHTHPPTHTHPHPHPHPSDYPPEIIVKHIIMADEMEVKLSDHLNEAVQFIHDNIQNNPSNKLLVHCEAGISRSPTIVIAYLMRYHNYSLKTAYNYMKQRKSNKGPHASFFEQLIQFGQQYKNTFMPSICLHDYLVQQMLKGAAVEFTRDEISLALKKTNNQVNKAYDLLFSSRD